ncbi:hypothetical protein NC661_08265 [Aquibacillus koreensis]|uniref:Uncharacterized protein n=1 Tax=Aquibacillus koreensis TaxID=279446 RepID=A0A9X3WI30_9BACI|nr:hypothetical protein [Aquibacillus koreensis]MCT2535901.1 hypothetical protein [Aquibacillus koreensis]MDC3420357.1 hypothetical protein [Aquibacillus koreensis]
MKRSFVGVILLCAILLMNIVFLQLLVHQYYFENYVAVLTYMGIMFLLFPLALWIYKKEKYKGDHSHEKE